MTTYTKTTSETTQNCSPPNAALQDLPPQAGVTAFGLVGPHCKSRSRYLTAALKLSFEWKNKPWGSAPNPALACEAARGWGTNSPPPPRERAIVTKASRVRPSARNPHPFGAHGFAPALRMRLPVSPLTPSPLNATQWLGLFSGCFSIGFGKRSAQ